MASLDYIYKLNYDNLETIFINLSTLNTSGIQTLSTFTGELGTLKYIVDFSDKGSGNVDPQISDLDYFVDFGDGVISNELSATHFYDMPGDYKVTLIVSDSANNLIKSTDEKIIRVKDPIPDQIIMTFGNRSDQFLSSPEAEFVVTRYNNVLTSRILSANNYKINLTVSGNNSTFFNESNYYKDRNSHLTRNAFFMDSIDKNFKVIDSISTTSTNIYGKIEGLNLVFNSNKSNDNFFIGTSGSGTFFYYED
jgi:PKD repeat protein